MNKPAKTALLLGALLPSALLSSAELLAEQDPFDFLLDDSNTVLSKPRENTAIAKPAIKPQSKPVTTEPIAPTPAENNREDQDPFAFLLDEHNTVLSSKQQTAALVAADRGWISLSALYVDDDNFTLGRYSGLNEKGWQPRLNAHYRSPLGDERRYWQARLQDIGSEVQEASFQFGQRDHYRLSLDYDQQLQAGNDSGSTPFSGRQRLTLPADWVASNTTTGMAALDNNRQFKQEQTRDKVSLNYLQRLNNNWGLEAEFRSENKQGQQNIGAAFYVDGSNPHAAILPQPIDQHTNELDVGFRFQHGALQANGDYLYSQFDNHRTYLQWQNPYSGVYGAGTDYPDGSGQLALAPDSELHALSGQLSYVINPKMVARGDVSYSLATQDDDFLPYTINDSLSVDQPLPRSSLDGEIATTVANAGLALRPLPKLSLDLSYRYYDRSNDSPRDGYQYPRGDAADQPASELTVYNRPFEVTKNRFEVSAHYRLPKQMRAGLKYQFENISRYNAATEETDESLLEASLRFRPTANSTARASLGFSDRAASRYHWDQSYYALLDSELINATPDSQRYNNHPNLSQFYLANREQLFAKLNVNIISGSQWSHGFDFSWQNRDYDESELGLTEERHINITASSNYLASPQLTLTGYISFDNYDAEQYGRAFRGGAEKNAFVSSPPYPQASDPARDWRATPETRSTALGFNVDWDIKPGIIDSEFDYSYVDTSSRQSFETFHDGSMSDLEGSSLPDDDSRLHHLKWAANYYCSDQLSLSLNYQYYRFDEDRWAVDGVSANTLDKVLTSGERAANDSLQLIGIGIEYRLQ